MDSLRFLFQHDDIRQLRAGDELIFSGPVYTARDQAHKRFVELLAKKKKLPLDLTGQAIYYCGPTATRPGKVIGSCGPTTSSRMDEFVEPLLAAGLSVMIGKGRRSKAVRAAIKKYKAVYLLAPAGCGAFIAQKVSGCQPVCFEDLGPEAVCRLRVKDLPLVVGIDSRGKSIYPDL